MGTDVRVGVLRVRGAGLAADPAAAVRQVEGLQLSACAECDHGVLVVRRLAVVAGDRSSAQRAIGELRHLAARPVGGRVDVRADAVLFADEADLLRCLTRDVLDGTAALAWYWRGLVPHGALTPAHVLGAAWLDRPRWVPTVVAELWAQDRGAAVRAVALVGEQAEAVRRALLAEYGRRGAAHTTAPPSPRRLLGASAAPRDESDAALGVPVLTEAELRLLDAALDCAGVPPRPVTATRGRAVERAGQSPQSGRGTEPGRPEASAKTPRPLSPPVEPGARDAGDRSGPAHHRADESGWPVRIAERPGGAVVAAATRAVRADGRTDADCAADQQPRQDIGAVDDLHSGPHGGPHSGAAPPAEVPAAPAPATWPGRHRPLRPRADDRSAAQGAEPPLPAVASSAGPSFWQSEPMASGLASALYVINLLATLGLTGPERPESLRTWRAVDELARWACRCAPSPHRRRDPLWGLLAGLDGRSDGSPPPRQLGARMTRARAVLADAGVAARAFRRPGMVLLTRTHLDVVLDLEDVDLTARLAGIDQDPGWVAELGRIVAFHFLSGGKP